MRAESLIIGAYLMYGLDVVVVNRIDTGSVVVRQNAGRDHFTVMLDDLTPIPITLDLLQRVGFRKEMHRLVLRLETRSYEVVREYDAPTWVFARLGQRGARTRLTGLHHLQALLMALEGEEITLKPETAPMNYALFCYILNDNLAYEHTDQVSADEKQEEWQELYTEFKAYWFSPESTLTPAQKVVQWVREYFSEFSFDTHSYQLKIRSEWISANTKPPTPTQP